MSVKSHKECGIIYVKYDSKLNEMIFNKINALQYDLIFSVIAILKDQKTKLTIMSFKQLKKITNIKKNLSLAEFEEKVKSLFNIEFYYLNESRYEQHALFNYIHVDMNDKTVAIEISDSLYKMINDPEFFTMFRLHEFVELKSVYSKTAYRLLCQYARTGVFHIDEQSFKRLFDIPKKYDMYEIQRRIVEPIEKELNDYYQDLEIALIENLAGKKIFKFKFKPKIYGAYKLNNPNNDD